MSLSVDEINNVPTFPMFLKFVESFLTRNDIDDIDSSLRVKLVFERFRKKLYSRQLWQQVLEEDRGGHLVVDDDHSDDVISLKSWDSEGKHDADEEEDDETIDRMCSAEIHSSGIDYQSVFASATTTATLSSPFTISKVFMSSLNRLQYEKKTAGKLLPDDDMKEGNITKERMEDIEDDGLLNFISLNCLIHCPAVTSVSSGNPSELVSFSPLSSPVAASVPSPKTEEENTTTKETSTRLEELKWSHLSLIVEFFKRNIQLIPFPSSSSSSISLNLLQYYYYQQKCDLILYHYHCYCERKRNKRIMIDALYDDRRRRAETTETTSVLTISSENDDENEENDGNEKVAGRGNLQDDVSKLERFQFLLHRCYFLLSPFCVKEPNNHTSSTQSSTASSYYPGKNEVKQQNLCMIWACIEELYQL
jgi:hypothetical protein